MLSHQFLNFGFLYFPPDAVVDAGIKQSPAPKTADDINDLFKSLDDEKPGVDKKEPKEEKEVKEPKKDKDETPDAEGEDDELELKEPDEDVEKLDLEDKDADKDADLEIDAPPRKKEILAKFPELFKTFPFLEKMMYRDRQITELFGSFDDAKEAATKVQSFDDFESQLLSGNTEEILKEVKATDEKAFNLIVDDYLPTLAKVDKDAYFHVTGNLNRRLIMEMVQEANDTNNDELKQAALLVNQFVFGTAKFTPPTRLVEKKDEVKDSEVEKERLSYLKERFETSRDELQSQVDNTLRATISEYIDPRGTMTPYVKKNAIADAMRLVSSAIAADGSVVKNLDNLWRASFDLKFSRDSLGKIKSFYLSKAKGQLKNAIMKARAEALKDSRPANRDKETDDVEEETPRQRRNIPTGRPAQPRNTNGPKKGESVSDYFMRD